MLLDNIRFKHCTCTTLPTDVWWGVDCPANSSDSPLNTWISFGKQNKQNYNILYYRPGLALQCKYSTWTGWPLGAKITNQSKCAKKNKKTENKGWQPFSWTNHLSYEYNNNVKFYNKIETHNTFSKFELNFVVTDCVHVCDPGHQEYFAA